MFSSCRWPLCYSLSETPDLLHGTARVEKFICIKMELKRRAVALWNQMDGGILPVSWLCKRLAYLSNGNHHQSAKLFWKTDFLWRGLCNILELGWYSPRQQSSRVLWMLSTFILFQREKQTNKHPFRLATAFSFNIIPEVLPLILPIPKIVSLRAKLFFIFKYLYISFIYLIHNFIHFYILTHKKYIYIFIIIIAFPQKKWLGCHKGKSYSPSSQQQASQLHTA